MTSPAPLFRIESRCPRTAARAGVLSLPRAVVPTPVFMPVGTLATVKACTPEEVAAIGYRLILANTFHLELRPGSGLVRRLGGLHRFMNWPHGLLTDSGGYQVFSLAKMRKITEEGARFQSPYDGSSHELTPESAIAIQSNLGSDVVMPLDECLEYGAGRSRVEASLEMTVRWLERCRRTAAGAEGFLPDGGHGGAAGGLPQYLFGIVQGGFFGDLRERSARLTSELDLPGHAIGGLSVGEPEPEMMAMLEAAVAVLPEEKPRYAMGVGLPLNLIDMVARGVDMFDCVVPTRNARNGRLYTFEGTLVVKNAAHAEDPRPVEEGCPCDLCTRYSRAYLRHLHMANEILAARLATLHNLTFFHRLMARIREAIPSGGLPALRAELAERYGAERPEPDPTRGS